MLMRRLVTGVIVSFAAMFGSALVAASPASAVSCPAGWSYDSGAHACYRDFGYTGSSQAAVVPSDVTQLTITAVGARGGFGGGDNQFNGNGGAPGKVGRVTGTVSVQPGDGLTILVGGVGANGTAGCDGGLGGCVSSYGYGGAGGTNPLGDYGGGGANQGAQRNSGGGGGGGAATVVDVGGLSIVAAGGGGGGGGGSSGAGGSNSSASGPYAGSRWGQSAVQSGGDGGGGAGGGGGAFGGSAGAAPGGDWGGGGGVPGANGVPDGFAGTYVAAQVGSVRLSFALAPLNTAVPTVPSSITAPTPVTGGSGTWTGATSTSLQWLRCTEPVTAATASGTLLIPGTCTAISDATSASYTPTVDDLGSYLALGVTATNSTGSTSAISATSAPVVLAPPIIDLQAASDTGSSSTDNTTADTTPTYDATGLAIGSSVTFTATKGADTVTCGPVVVAANPTSCTFPTMVDGTWVVTAKQSFGAAESAASNTVAMLIDTDPPAAPSGASLAPASDTGVSGSDRITNDSTPTIDLTGLEVGTRAVVTASKPGSPDVTCVIATVTNASQSCTFSSALSDGMWSFSAVQQDLAGNSSPATAPFTAMIDTSAGISLSSSPSATGTGPTSATSFTFTATLTDAPANGTAFTATDVQLGGSSTGWTVGSVTQVSPTQYRFAVSATSPTAGTLSVAVPSGSYQDAAGNTATSSSTWQSTIITTTPTNTAPPVITATTGTTTTLGSTLSSSTGTWNDQLDTTPSTAYQWQVCDTGAPNPTGCVDVAGATSQTWVPTGIAEGKFVRSIVTRSNVVGSTSQASVPVGPMTKAPQTIVFSDPTDRAFSPTPFAISPVSNIGNSANPTGLVVTMTPTDPSVCTATATTVTMLKAGTCELTATQPGSDAFDAAVPVVQSFVISKASQTATTTPSVAQAEPTATVTVSTAQSGTGAVTYSVVSGPCTVVGNVVTGTGNGDCLLATNVAADDRYAATTAPNTTVRFRSIDTITAPATPDRLTSAGGFAWAPTARSGRALTVQATGSCAYVNGTVTPKAAPEDAGPCTLTTALADDGSWSSANFTQTFNFAKPPSAPTNVSATVAGASGVAGGTAQVSFTPVLNGSSLVDHEVVAAPVGGGAPVSARCAASPCTVTGLAAGTAYTFTVTTNASAAGTPVQSPPSSVSNQVTVTATHPVSLANPGRKLPTDAPFTLVPIDGVNPAGWSPTLASLTPSVCTVSGTTVTLVGSGTCELKASHPGGAHAGIDYGFGETVVSFPVGAPPAASGGQGGGAASDSVAPVAVAPALPMDDGPDAVVGTGAANGAGPTRGIKPPPAPARTSVHRVRDGQGATVTIELPQAPADAPIEAVGIVVLDGNGQVVTRLAVPVIRGQAQVTASIPFFPQGYTVRTYTTNVTGVSRRAPVGTNVLKRPTAIGVRKDGTPILFGKQVAKPILFDPDSPELDNRDARILDGVVRYVEKHGGRAFVTGFVRNWGGDPKFQKRLSSDRAANVAMYLSKRGVDAWIRYDGYGPRRPGQGKPEDRRVEVRWSMDEIPGLVASPEPPSATSAAVAPARGA